MVQSVGYIYVRYNLHHYFKDNCKLGETDNIPERNQTYVTYEQKRGYFEVVFEIIDTNVKVLETSLKHEFRYHHVKYDGGTEFFNKQIVKLIEPYLSKNSIEYRKLRAKEIAELYRPIREKDATPLDINIEKRDTQHTKSPIFYIPRDYQLEIVQKSVSHFEKHDKGILTLICGIGKTLISLWIAQHLQSNTILIGVPNLVILDQWIKIVNVLFPHVAVLAVFGCLDIQEISRFLETNKNGRCIVITTYSSTHKVYSATQDINFSFSVKILDEVHHLTSTGIISSNIGKKYIRILDIPSSKQISLTATLKTLESKTLKTDIISNDSIQHFGEIIDRKSLLWAIENNILCDYNIQTILPNQEQLEEKLSNFYITRENDKRMFLSAFTALKSVYDGNSHHLLIYCNNTSNSSKLIHYIELLLIDFFDIPDIYYSNYDSEISTRDQEGILNQFKQSKYGIITCVYCLGEGWDCPLLDGVVFAENMSSNIRIVQCALRASRKNSSEPNKKTKIILPILNPCDWSETNDNLDLKKVREVIYQMSIEDETICQKMEVSRIDIKKQNLLLKSSQECPNDAFGVYDQELTDKLLLKTISRSSLSMTYEKARKIINANHVKTKDSYYQMCEKDHRLPIDPEIHFNGSFKNWVEYLSIERIYYDMETCKRKIYEYLSLYPKIRKEYLDLSRISYKLSSLDPLFPPSELWIDYYNIKNLNEIIHISTKKKKCCIMV